MERRAVPAQPPLAVPVLGAAALDEGPETARMAEGLEMRHLVLDHVVEDLLRREQEPPVEAHRAVLGAARPAGALTADREPLVVGPGARGHGVEPGGDLDAGAPAVPTLEGVTHGGLAGNSHRDPQLAAPERDVGPDAARLDPHAKEEIATQVRHRAAVGEAGVRG